MKTPLAGPARVCPEPVIYFILSPRAVTRPVPREPIFFHGNHENTLAIETMLLRYEIMKIVKTACRTV